MNTLLLILFSFLSQPPLWLNNFDDARKRATVAHQPILVYFSGSDWCVPCIRLSKDLLESDEFGKYASAELQLLRADFPRMRKNKLPAVQVKINEALAERYNPDGKFPYTLLLDEDGRVLKAWEGYINATPAEFCREIEVLQVKHADGK